MSNNFTYKYISGAEVTLKSTEDTSVTPAVHTPHVNVGTSGLPSGAATAAAQALLLTELQAKADLAETQPVSAATLPLPSGAATAAAQTDKSQYVRVTDGTTDEKLPTSTVATSGASPLSAIGASASNKHRIFSLVITADTAGTLTIADGFGGVYVAANGAVALNFGRLGRLQTTANTAITITNSGGGNISAHGTYATEAA